MAKPRPAFARIIPQFDVSIYVTTSPRFVCRRGGERRRTQKTAPAGAGAVQVQRASIED